jgi:DNA-binding CsgD family transcriptional regulator
MSNPLLSEREMEVAVLAVTTALTTNEMAERLGITPGTVKIHLHTIYTKMGVHRRLELALKLRPSP